MVGPTVEYSRGGIDAVNIINFNAKECNGTQCFFFEQCTRNRGLAILFLKRLSRDSLNEVRNKAACAKEPKKRAA